MIFFFDIPRLAAEAKKTAKATGQKLSEVQHAMSKATGYTSWSSMVGAAIGPDKPEALVAWFARKHEPMRDDVDSWIYDELLSEARPEQVLADARYDTSPGFDVAVDQIWNQAVWYSRAQVETANWFVRNHASADNSPYNGREGGYLWPTVEVLDVLQHQFPRMPEKDVEEVAQALDSQGAWFESKRLRQVEEEAMAEAMDRPSPVPPVLGSAMRFPSPEELLGPTGLAAIEENLGRFPFVPKFDGPVENLFIENIIKPIQAQADGDDEL